MSLPFLTANELTGTAHGFFTRQGGVSTDIYNSLNTGLGSEDARVHVLENRDRVRHALGAKALLTAHQTHSSITAYIDAPQDMIKADALVTTTKGLAIGALAADCAPVLLADMKNGVIGAAHSGWRGAFDGILASVIDTMVSHGAQKQHMRAIIGPCISQQAYEIGPEFIAQFERAHAADLDLFVPSAKNGHYMFDLPALCAARSNVAMSPRAGWVYALTPMKNGFFLIAAPRIAGRPIMVGKFQRFACPKILCHSGH